MENQPKQSRIEEEKAKEKGSCKQRKILGFKLMYIVNMAQRKHF